MPKVFIVEDYSLLREQLVHLLETVEGMRVCGAAGSAEEALQEIPEVNAEIVLLDVSLPGMNGFEMVSALQGRLPEVACLLISAHRDRHYSSRAREVGARGYVVKGDLSGLRAALTAVAGGKSYFDSVGHAARRQAANDNDDCETSSESPIAK